MLSTPHGVGPSTTRGGETRIGLSELAVLRFACAPEYAGFPALLSAVREKLFSYLSSLERLQQRWESNDSTVSVYRGVEAIGSKRNTDV